MYLVYTLLIVCREGEMPKTEYIFHDNHENISSVVANFPSKNSSKETISEMLCEIIETFNAHFEYEEHMMIKSRYHNIDIHRADHQNFYRQLSHLIYMFETNFHTELIPIIFEMVTDWLVQHTEIDNDLINYFGKK